MSFFQHNVVAFLVALVTCSFAWVWGGTRSDWVLAIAPWTWMLLLEGMLFFPQRHGDETSRQARLRVWNGLRRDPFAWTAGIFLLLLAIPFLNTALCPVCDAQAIADGAVPGPRLARLPFCTNRMEHLNVFLWFGPALTAALAVRHSLVRSGRRLVVRLIVFSAAALALFGFAQLLTGARAPYWIEPMQYASSFFASFGYANMGADYFMATTILALAVWRRRLDVMPIQRHRHHTHTGAHARTHRDEVRRGFGAALRELGFRHWPLALAALLFCATFATLSRAGILLVTAGTAFLLVHALVSLFARLDRLGRVRAAAALVLAVALLAVSVMVLLPKSVSREVGTVDAVGALDRVTGRNEYHADVALRLVRDHPLFGCGGWGYRHYCIPYLSAESRRHLGYGWTRGGANVHNDSLQFMVEHGAVGFALLVLAVVLLLAPTCSVWRRLARAARFAPREERPPHPVGFFSLPAPALSLLVAAAATFVHSFCDCPLRSPAVLSLFLIELAAATGYLPELDDAADGESDYKPNEE